MMKLKGRVALVTGGGAGIGEGIARCLNEEGAEVAVCDIDLENAKRVVDSLQQTGGTAFAICADLVDEAEAQKAVQQTVGHFGQIDILVNNVGGVSDETLRKMIEYSASLGDPTLPPHMRFNGELWDRFYQLNLRSHALLSNAATPLFVSQRSGSIVNISSVAGRTADPGNIAYAANKAGDISLTWSLARALAPYNVRVNCVCPGFVYTPLWIKAVEAMLGGLRLALSEGRELPAPWSLLPRSEIEELPPYEFWLKYIVLPNTPLGAEQTTEDMGRAVAFLASDDAKNVTGQVLHVDGEMIMR